jgi:hypothetical protein
MQGLGQPFAKGQSGNSAGRQPGTRRRAYHGPEGRPQDDRAPLDGETVALRLCVDRLIPVTGTAT